MEKSKQEIETIRIALQRRQIELASERADVAIAAAKANGWMPENPE